MNKIVNYIDTLSEHLYSISDKEITILLTKLDIPVGIVEFTYKVRKEICRVDIRYPTHNVHIEFSKGFFKFFNDLATDENKAIFEE